MPDFFGKRVGQIYLKMIIQKVCQFHHKILLINVMSTKTVAVYQKAGFGIVGHTRFEYPLLKPEERNTFVLCKKI